MVFGVWEVIGEEEGGLGVGLGEASKRGEKEVEMFGEDGGEGVTLG